jgi:hypothetical protein
MRTVVVYESLTGTTRVVARALAGVAWSFGEVALVSVDDCPPSTLVGVDLLLVGGPTHARGATWATTKRMARERLGERFGPAVDRLDECPGIHRWLGEIGRVDGIRAAAFDTRLEGAGVVTGRASLGIARNLRAHGFVEVAAPRSFLVDGDGHLCEGQRIRAEEWAESVIGVLAPAQVG